MRRPQQESEGRTLAPGVPEPNKPLPAPLEKVHAVAYRVVLLDLWVVLAEVRRDRGGIAGGGGGGAAVAAVGIASHRATGTGARK